MGLNQAKVFHGPFNFELWKTVTGTPTKVAEWTGLKKDTMTVAAARNEVSEEIEDASKMYDDGGADLEVSIAVSEVDEDKCAAIDTDKAIIDKVILAFPNKNRRYRLVSPRYVTYSLEGGKLKVIAKKGIGATDNIVDHLVPEDIA